MIESRYWKADLLSHARRLAPEAKPRRWSEKAVVNFEKELMISFFMVRALLERNKTSPKSTRHEVPVGRCPWNGKRVTALNYPFIEDIYDWDREKLTTVPITFLANQFIHSRAIFAVRDSTRNWSEVLVCSDFETRKAIYRVSVPAIRYVFSLVGSDYPSVLHLAYDDKLDDYRITTG